MHNVTQSYVSVGNEQQLALEDTMTSWTCLLYSYIMHGLLLGVVCVLGLLGNSLSFAVFWRDPVKSSTHFLLQTLAVVDSLLLLTALPLHSLPAYLSFAHPLLYDSYVQHIFPFIAVYVYPLAMIYQTMTVWITVLIGLNRVSRCEGQGQS